MKSWLERALEGDEILEWFAHKVFTCPECGYSWRYGRTKYCPDCGARLKSEEEEKSA